MTGSEQAKAALAALADGERGRSAERQAANSPERGEGVSESSGLNCGETVPEERFEWGKAGTGYADAAAAYRAVIQRAVAATEDVEAAADFVESVGLDGLERAVERAEREVSGLAKEGREALTTFERFRVAAEGSFEE